MEISAADIDTVEFITATPQFAGSPVIQGNITVIIDKLLFLKPLSPRHHSLLYIVSEPPLEVLNYLVKVKYGSYVKRAVEMKTLWEVSVADTSVSYVSDVAYTGYLRDGELLTVELRYLRYIEFFYVRSDEALKLLGMMPKQVTIEITIKPSIS